MPKPATNNKNKIRNGRQIYRLMVDPERLVENDTLKSWVLEILVENGGRVSREEMVAQFTKRLAKRRPHVECRPTSLLSEQLRMLRDANLLQVIGTDGTVLKTRRRSSLVK